MAVLHLADTRLDLRQVLASGRFFEAFTERAIDGFTAELSYDGVGRAGRFATTLVTKPAGYFALHSNPSRALPDLAAAGSVTLTLRLVRPGEADVVVTQDVSGADLALVETEATVAGQQVTTLRVDGAPFTFNARVLPPPVLLDGLVLVDHDPETAAAGATVTAAPLAPVVTDEHGRFRIPALPVAETVDLEFDHDGRRTELEFLPDYARTAMTATFSIPGP